MSKKSKRNLPLIWLLAALCVLTAAGIYHVFHRGCSPSATYLCWTPEDNRPTERQTLYLTSEMWADLPYYHRHRSISWRLHCDEGCRKASECYYYCCGGDPRSDQSAAPEEGSDTCRCRFDMYHLPVKPSDICDPEMSGNLRRIMHAAERGDAKAQTKLARLYERGRNDDPAQNLMQAIHWYYRAAENGHRYAQFKIGEMLESGRSMATDCKAAMGWYEKAGRAQTQQEEKAHDDYATFTGIVAARKRLAEIYGKGLCGPVNAVEALYWQQWPPQR